MTVIESGTAVNVNYNETDARAVAIHEAGHAAAAHVYVPEVESSRLSIKMRGQSLGHHQSFEKEERFGAFQSRMFGELIHAVGAMAAELVFYGENSVGVGGDLHVDHLDGDRHGRRRRHVPAADRPQRQDVRRRDRGADARARHEAARGHRRPADEPHRRRLAVALRSAEARLRRPVHRRGIRDRLQPDPRRTRRRSRRSRTRSSRRRRSTATTSSVSSTSRTSSARRSTGRTRASGRSS